TELRVIEGSVATVSIDSRAARVAIEREPGVATPLVRGGDGRFAQRVELTRSGYLLVTADDGARRLMAVAVAGDALPSVRSAAPGRDLIFAGGDPGIRFDVDAEDDFGLRSLSLRYTKVSGSGEQFDFEEGEIPLAVTRASGREWRGSASRSLGDLQLQEGDML